jgi:hypothetical protein
VADGGTVFVARLVAEGVASDEVTLGEGKAGN